MQTHHFAAFGLVASLLAFGHVSPVSARTCAISADAAQMFAAVTLAAQADQAKSVKVMTADSFTPLLNGKDLSGWVNVNTSPTTWSAKNGEIFCTGVPTGVLRTEKSYRNFVLELEWMHESPTGNAGLFIWSDPITAKGQPFTRSVEVQIMLGDEYHEDGKLMYTSQGDIFSIHGATMKPDRPHPAGWARCLPSENRTKGAGEWNHYRVTAIDGTIKLAINGKEVSGAFDVNPREGFICLESEGSPVHFRNIRIQELPAGEPLALDAKCMEDQGFRSIFTGSLQGWREQADLAGHWKVDDWKLTYDGRGETLWSLKSYANFELIADWRWSGTSHKAKVPVVRKDGTTPVGSDGKPETVEIDEFGDSGIFLRGNDKSQVNIWSWPVGSGEVYGYRTDPSQTAQVRAGVTPSENADAPPGKWNRMKIKMQGDRLTVVLNGKTVLDNARLPGVPADGPIALQHHGAPIEFANIYMRELPPS
jgi:hypothetical protein